MDSLELRDVIFALALRSQIYFKDSYNMKKFILSAASFAVVAFSAVAVAPTTSEAIPAYARQTGAACLSCHFQAIPRLAAFGRNFRMNAGRDVGEQALLEDDHLSLPAYFNTALLVKARISTGKTTTNGVVTARGGVLGTPATAAAFAIQWPDEAALLIGGRYGEHMGGMTEWGYAPTAAGDISAGPLGMKLAYVFDTDMGPIAIAGGTTDALGAPSIFNDPSNAISRNLRGIQTRANALRGGILHAGVTGVGVYGHINDLVYFAAGIIEAAGGGPLFASAGAADLNANPYLRLALTTELAGFDFVGGFWYGKTSVPNYKWLGATAVSGDVKDYGLDIQFQGEVGDLSVGFYMPAVLNRDVLGATNSVIGKISGFNPYVNIAMGHIGVRLGYDYAKNTAASTKFTNIIIGAWFSVAQNVELDLEYNNAKTDTTAAPGIAAASVKANSTTLMLEYVY